MANPGYFSGRIPAALLPYLVTIKGAPKPTSDKPYSIGFAMGEKKSGLVQMSSRLQLHINDFEAMDPPCDVCLYSNETGRSCGIDYESFLQELRQLRVRDITDPKVYEWLRAVYAEQMAQ